ncbi:oxygen-dependent protoporphyrinogen oxidase [Plasmodium inui San Antonio 1]|uniref:Oxygen-dependent protoporphyrinogen oxidase n=1 Tax=Plasmodium inui San Antonio 1 TaxID=1237626 RepID=W7AAV1_9APIC|nr:oxygen-dependent protoporphyrinogen oxidase [Plasmodium inui San Antonio 1]EUD66204.1 oxygen-dependent protoporphyrinogen oxidase [Plasmodium inui San Antonio 1]
MNFVKVSLDSYPVKYYNRTHKVTNTLRLKGIGLLTWEEDDIINFFQNLDLTFMVYLILQQNVVYVEFYKKKDSSYVFNILNHNPPKGQPEGKTHIQAEYVNVRYDIKEDSPIVYSRDLSGLLGGLPGKEARREDSRETHTGCESHIGFQLNGSELNAPSSRDDVSIQADAIGEDFTQEVIRTYEQEQWLKYTKNDEINLCHYFCRSTPNKIYKSYCIQDPRLFFSLECLDRIRVLLDGRQPNQISILKCHVNKAVEYVIESRHIFQDEIAFLVMKNDLPMSFLDIRNETKTNLIVAKNTLIKIKGRRRYELIFGIPKKKTLPLEGETMRRKDSYLIIFRFIDEPSVKKMLTQKHRNQKVKDEPQEKSCVSVEVGRDNSDNIERTYVLDVYNKIAQHFCYTRYKSWNNVENLINEEQEGNLIMDVGCGNGKNVQVSSKYFFIGLDFSWHLLRLAQKKWNSDLFLANCVSIPFRSNIADLCISIAVIHHIGTHAKRRNAVAEMVRCTKVGGKILIYVWAYEQQANVVGNRKFDSQDIFVPWYLQPQHTLEGSEHVNEAEAVEREILHPAKKDLQKLQRYYHVFRKEELHDLCLSISGKGAPACSSAWIDIAHKGMNGQEGGVEAGVPEGEDEGAEAGVSPEQHTYDVIIVGGGVFSCCLHYYLKRKKPDIKILILEKEQTLGGYIKTEWIGDDKGKNFLCDLGPNILKISDDSYELLKELNLLSHVRVLNRRLLRYVYACGGLYPLRLNIWGYFAFPLISVTNKVKLIFKLLFKRYKKLSAYDEDISVEEYMRENFDLQHYNFLLLPLIYGSCGGVGSISAVSFFSRNLKLGDNKLNTLRVWKERMGGGLCRVDSLRGDEVGCAAAPSNEGKTPTGGKHISVGLQHAYARGINGEYDQSSSFNNVMHRQDTRNGETIGWDTVGGDAIEETSGHHAGMDTMKGQPPFVDTPHVEVYLHFVKRIYQKCKRAVLQVMPPLYPQLAKKDSNEYEEKKKKKKILGKTISLKYGMYEIIDKLEKNINKKYVWTNEEVDSVEKHNEDTWVCTMRRKHSRKTSCIYGRNVILTVNSKTCANIMRKILPPEMKANLVNVQYSSLISVIVYYHKKDITLPPNCFGILSADKTNHILGCFYTSNIFKERCNDDSVVLLTLYMGGQNNPNDVYMEEKDIIEIVSRELTKIFHVENNAQPVILKVKKWIDSIPFYSQNYERNLKCFLNELHNPEYRNLFVDSSWITGTSISDRIVSARDLSEFMAASVFPVKPCYANAALA